MERVTISDIAKACNVSIGTVDRAINNRGRINLQTKQRILSTAKQMGYSKNKFASALRRQQTFRIAVLIPREPHFFFRFIEEGVQKACSELQEYNIRIDRLYTGFLDHQEQAKLLADIDPKLYDGLVLSAASDLLQTTLQRFLDAGVQITTFNSGARHLGQLFYVGEDPYTSGCLCGRTMGRFLGGRGHVAVLASFLLPGSPAERVRGFIDILQKDFPDIQLITPSEYFDRETTAYALTERTMQRGLPIDGMFANSASGTVGICRFFADHKTVQKPVLIGYDVTAEVQQFLLDGICDMVVDQSPQMQSYYAITLLCRHLLEQWTPPVPILEIRTRLVFQDNAKDYPAIPDARHFFLL